MRCPTLAWAVALASSAILHAADVPILPLSFGADFNPPSIQVNGISRLSFYIYNPNQVQLNGLYSVNHIAFTATLPSGVIVATPNGILAGTNASHCGNATLSAEPGSNQLGVVGDLSLFQVQACVLSVNVVGTTPGVKMFAASALTAPGIPPGTASPVTLTVLPDAPIAVTDAFQVRYASNLVIGDSVINFTNNGASSTVSFPAQNGSLCVNVYTFSPDEQLISCCSCPVTPNGLASLSARNDLISNTLTPAVPTAIVVKLLATTGVAGACNAATAGTGANVTAPGLAAWGTTIHALPLTLGSPATTFGQTETSFTQATLSPAELARLTTLCGFIQTNGSGFGLCRSCRLGGLGGAKL